MFKEGIKWNEGRRKELMRIYSKIDINKMGSKLAAGSETNIRALEGN